MSGKSSSYLTGVDKINKKNTDYKYFLTFQVFNFLKLNAIFNLDDLKPDVCKNIAYFL